MIGASNGALYHIWQPEQGDSWSNWDHLGTFSDGAKFTSLPFIVIDDVGWWEAYGVSGRGEVGEGEGEKWVRRRGRGKSGWGCWPS